MEVDMKKFGDVIQYGDVKAVIVRVEKKKKWTYYWIVPEDFEFTGNDWQDYLIGPNYNREDEI